MQYNSAMFVSSKTRNVTVRNLDSNTRYAVRVVSVNAYGQQPSEGLLVQTKGKLNQKIHLRTTHM